MKITIKRVTIGDAGALLSISRKTFFESFAHLNKPANMDAYAATAFTPGCFERQLQNAGSEFYFAMLDNSVVTGYIKLNFYGAQTEPHHDHSLEIERIYVDKPYAGKGIGKKLLEFAGNIARQKYLKELWLGVWEHNESAIAFYRHLGFITFGSHDFMLGDDQQTDLLMKKLI